MSKQKRFTLSQFIEEQKAIDPEFAVAYEAERFRLELANRRVSAGMTQEDVAEAMGTTQSTVARIERRPLDVRAGTLLRYLLAIGVERPLDLGSGGLVVRESRARGSYRKRSES